MTKPARFQFEGVCNKPAFWPCALSRVAGKNPSSRAIGFPMFTPKDSLFSGTSLCLQDFLMSRFDKASPQNWNLLMPHVSSLLVTKLLE